MDVIKDYSFTTWQFWSQYLKTSFDCWIGLPSDPAGHSGSGLEPSTLQLSPRKCSSPPGWCSLRRGTWSWWWPSWRPNFNTSFSLQLALEPSFIPPLSHTLLLYLCFALQMAMLGFYHDSSLFTSPVTSFHTGARDDMHCEREQVHMACFINCALPFGQH